MLTNLAIRNFKSWRDTGDMPLAPLTLLFGTNSSGKTSLLQLLLLLKQTADSPDRSQVLNTGDARSLVDLGTYAEMIYRHDDALPLEWGVEWSLSKRLTVTDPATSGEPLFEGETLGFEAKVVRDGQSGARGTPRVERMTYRFAGCKFGMQVKTPTQNGGGSAQYDLLSSSETFQFKRTTGRAWDLPPPIRFYGFPDQVRAYYQNAGFLSDLELKFEQLLASIYYLGPLRDYPKRQYTWSGERPAGMGRRGELAIAALLASSAAGELIARGKGLKRLTLEHRVALWLRELGLIDSFSVRPVAEGAQLFQVWVKRSAGAPEVMLTDVGFGVSQILPVIALCYYAPKGSILLLEQPEIHLHPSVQAGLADVFIDAIKTRDIQIIIESHSEHLLRRLQRRMAEEVLPSAGAALYNCSMQSGESKLAPLSVNTFGSITNWPEGFFGDEFAEIAATQTAIQRRRKAAV